MLRVRERGVNALHWLMSPLGIFGDYTQDDVVVEAGKTTALSNVVWRAESAGKELWRIGVPDKTSGKYIHSIPFCYIH